MRRLSWLGGLFGVACWMSSVSTLLAADVPAPQVAAAVDQLILKELKAGKVEPAKLSNDEDFLRRVSLDISGAVPSAREVTLFGLDPDPAKRAKIIDRLLDSDDYAATWSRYWKDVFLLRATNMRAPLVGQPFLDWMTKSLKDNKRWDAIATELLTATGEVSDDGRTALFFAHEGDANEVAGEVSRIFLGIQIQCANCHNHPWDRWKREDFHELAAFFPRVTVRRSDPNDMRSYEVASFNGMAGGRQAMRGRLTDNPERFFAFADRNKDGKITKDEAGNSPIGQLFDRILQIGDKNKDGGMSLAEFKELPPPMDMPGRGESEHFMPDLNNPAAQGKQIDPKLFATGVTAKPGASDLERRSLFAATLTDSKNEWFSKALVNRLWAELTGQGFYMPVDDMGPDRKPSNPEALDRLAQEFTAHKYDLKWLLRTIALTETYQRQIQFRPASEDAPAFASATPTRLRGDQLYSSLVKVLGAEGEIDRTPPTGGGAARFLARSPRDRFVLLFGFDPSTPQDDITGTVPQALFMMNSPQIASQVRGDVGTRLAELLRKYPDDLDALNELYLMVLSREPSKKELTICQNYIKQVGNRREAFEDLMWSVLNSSEFLSKR